jgi:YD repeat-containing protein
MRSPIFLGFCLLLAFQGNARSETITYEYDELGRLKKTTKAGGPATGAQTTTTFDPAGNRTNQTTTGVGGVTPPPPSNQPPFANADTVSVQCNLTTTKNVTANDTDPENNSPLVVQSASIASGTASATIASGTSLSITGGTFAGASQINYVVADSLGATSTGLLTVTTTGTSAQCTQ